jgi:alanine-glyoxylate transaminase/(R)-3-amino-2-methylpropionate-pyruvate transaminase
MIGMEVVTDKKEKTRAGNDLLVKIMTDMAYNGVLIGRGGLYYNRLRIEPPLCISKNQADQTLNTLEKVLRKIEKNI